MVNTAAGFAINFCVGILIAGPAIGVAGQYGIAPDHPVLWVGITLLYTVISVARNYFVRRWYARRHTPEHAMIRS